MTAPDELPDVLLSLAPAGRGVGAGPFAGAVPQLPAAAGPGAARPGLRRCGSTRRIWCRRRSWRRHRDFRRVRRRHRGGADRLAAADPGRATWPTRPGTTRPRAATSAAGVAGGDVAASSDALDAALGQGLSTPSARRRRREQAVVLADALAQTAARRPRGDRAAPPRGAEVRRGRRRAWAAPSGRCAVLWTRALERLHRVMEGHGDERPQSAFVPETTVRRTPSWPRRWRSTWRRARRARPSRRGAAGRPAPGGRRAAAGLPRRRWRRWRGRRGNCCLRRRVRRPPS